jgi:hypothetical protein
LLIKLNKRVSLGAGPSVGAFVKQSAVEKDDESVQLPLLLATGTSRCFGYVSWLPPTKTSIGNKQPAIAIIREKSLVEIPIAPLLSQTVGGTPSYAESFRYVEQSCMHVCTFIQQ